jgi:hypothetical protein
MQTTAGISHAQQPISAFFYKVNDATSGTAGSCNPGEKRDTTPAFITHIKRQACLFNRLTAGSRPDNPIALVGLNLSDHAFNVTKTPFFCDPNASFYSCDEL